MSAIRFTLLPAPLHLRQDIECFRIAHYSGSQGLAVNVCPNGLPGIVLQCTTEQSVIRSIATSVGQTDVPKLFMYGQVTQPSVMHFKPGPFTTVQVLLRPYALKTLFTLDAATLTDGFTELDTILGQKRTAQLLKTFNPQDAVTLFSDVLSDQAASIVRDAVVQKSIQLIDSEIGLINAASLLARMPVSERQFEKRFAQSVGISPQFYIRVKRFNKAMRLMKTGQYERLVDVAHALNFHDQSHFIRDIKAFSGVTPMSIMQKVDEFFHDDVGFSFL